MDEIDAPFEKLALGARFRYLRRDRRWYVKLSSGGQIAEWEPEHRADMWAGQRVMSFGLPLSTTVYDIR